MLVRPPPARGPREPGIHLSEAGRAAPSPFSPGTLKARSPAGSTIWAATLLGFLCSLLNVLLSCKPISPFRLPGRAVGALGAPLTSGNARAPPAALPGPEGSRRAWRRLTPAFQDLVLKVFFNLLGKTRISPLMVSFCNMRNKL